ncbi:MAG: [NiFe]-hydrogenase assembly chaperone HybE [Rhodocyclaceae bacterium]|nr:[NiFe]-hydrogenase assembly chaperone HybE [Rhodocyclaceae bacterium]
MFAENPSAQVEATFRRIQTERMAGLPLLNPVLEVAAVGFARHGNDWRGVLVTPWCIDLLLVPARADWTVPGPHERVFRQYASGNFAFLPNHEDGLGDYLICALIHDMNRFPDQESACMTAQACLIALDLAPVQPAADPAAPGSSSRRKFLSLGS